MLLKLSSYSEKDTIKEKISQRSGENICKTNIWWRICRRNLEIILKNSTIGKLPPQLKTEQSIEQTLHQRRCPGGK